MERTERKTLKKHMKKTLIIVLCNIFVLTLMAQNKVPDVYSNIHYDENGKLYYQKGEERIYALPEDNDLTLEKMIGSPRGTTQGVFFDFQDSLLRGTLYFGLIDYKGSKHPQPVYFKHSVPIITGKAHVSIKLNLTGKYDMTGWEKSGKGTLGYRIIRNDGDMLYDGVVSFIYDGKFKVDTTIIEGPFVNNVTENNAVLFFTTNIETKCNVSVNSKLFSDKASTKIHQIEINELEPGKVYEYEIHYGSNKQSYSFKTAPLPGSRKPLCFAYASDSRGNTGGGERHLFGVNAYIMKKIMALCVYKEVDFLQFSGDLINGYSNSVGSTELQYANWKKVVEPFAHYLPVYTTIGNHEALVHKFFDKSTGYTLMIDKFPFETVSAEAVFARNFVNPTNGLESEDNSKYDPDKKKTDFPSYSEATYSFTYDNVGMIVLNSNYFYAPIIKGDSATSGNLHAYIMNNQLDWLKKEVEKFEADTNIDHVFVSLHTPAFPNGGHSKDDMWYSGSNKPRAYVNGKPVDEGIIQRRDKILDILINQNTKVVALLTGDEHNYNRLLITDKTDIYPEDYKYEKIKIKRNFYQINNGAAGAPYYAQEKLPWSDFVSGFSTQNAIVFIFVDGKKVNVEVYNPDTLEKFDEFELR